MQVIINTLTNEPQIAREVESDIPPKPPADVILKPNEEGVVYEGAMPSLNLATLRWNDITKELENNPTYKSTLTKAQEDWDTNDAAITNAPDLATLKDEIRKLLGSRPEEGWQD